MKPITVITDKDRKFLLDLERDIKEIRKNYPRIKIFVDLDDSIGLDEPYFIDICPGQYVRFFNTRQGE